MHPRRIVACSFLLCVILTACTATFVPLEKPWTPQKFEGEYRIEVRKSDGTIETLFRPRLEGTGPDEGLRGTSFSSEGKQYVERTIPIDEAVAIDVQSDNRGSNAAIFLFSLGMIALYAWIFGLL